MVRVNEVGYVRHDGIVRETKQAVCYRIRGAEVWLPRSQIVIANGEVVGVPMWLLLKKQIERDW